MLTFERCNLTYLRSHSVKYCPCRGFMLVTVLLVYLRKRRGEQRNDAVVLYFVMVSQRFVSLQSTRVVDPSPALLRRPPRGP